MASIPQPGRAERAASNARLRAGGGFICADAPSAGTSAAAIPRPTSMPRSIRRPQVTRSSRASSRASDGSTTIVTANSLPARSFTPRTPTPWINRCPDRLRRCLRTGKRCFTSNGNHSAETTSLFEFQTAHSPFASSRAKAKRSRNNRAGLLRTTSRSRDAKSARVLNDALPQIRGRRESRVFETPAASYAKVESIRVSHHGYAERIRPSLRDWF